MAQIVRNALDIGVLLKQARKESGLTQADLALVAGTGNRVIVEAERGKPTTQIDILLHLIHMVGLDVVIQKKGSEKP